MAEKIQNAQFIVIFSILRQQLNLVGANVVCML